MVRIGELPAPVGGALTSQLYTRSTGSQDHRLSNEVVVDSQSRHVDRRWPDGEDDSEPSVQLPAGFLVSIASVCSIGPNSVFDCADNQKAQNWSEHDHFPVHSAVADLVCMVVSSAQACYSLSNDTPPQGVWDKFTVAAMRFVSMVRKRQCKGPWGPQTYSETQRDQISTFVNTYRDLIRESTCLSPV